VQDRLSVTVAFDPFIAIWIDVEPLIYERIDQLDTLADLQGTLEDFANLINVIDHVLRELAAGGVAPTRTVEYACVFVRLWRVPDRLAEHVLRIASAYDGCVRARVQVLRAATQRSRDHETT
jgi:hypothetical protein